MVVEQLLPPSWLPAIPGSESSVVKDITPSNLLEGAADWPPVSHDESNEH